MLGDADFFLAFGDFELSNAGLFDEIDQFFQFAQIPAGSPVGERRRAILRAGDDFC